MSAEYNAKFANTDIATRAIHAGQEPDPTTGAVVDNARDFAQIG